MRILIPLIAATGLALLVHGLPLFGQGRFAGRVDPYLNGLAGRPSALLPGAHASAGWRSRLQQAATRFLPFDSSALHGRLIAAGWDRSVQAHRLDQIMWAVGGAVGGGLFAALGAGGGAVRLDSILFAAVFGGSGWIAADRRLARAVAQRRDRVREELPVAIDLLTLSIMAGEAVPQAFARVGELLGGVVGAELRRVVGAVRTGVPVVEALQELPSRLPDASAARLVDALCTGIERGAPLAETLRAQADDLRQATRRDLLESGGRREILMLIPVVFLILPTIVAFTLLPGLVSLDLLVP